MNGKICNVFLSLLSVLVFPSFATFSICAIDTLTGEVGSAGGSCINNSIIISDVHPNVGVIHTQANYLQQNQTYARTLMDKLLTPQEIIDSVVAHDAQRNSGPRQYGVVVLKGSQRSAGYTGSGCSSYANHIAGPTYAIQGNILLGRQIIDLMESRFNREKGDLACKLMAALQGAKVRGADTRCMNNTTSTLSAFIRVAKPDDGTRYAIDINVPSTPSRIEPIDSLQKLFDKVHTCAASVIRPAGASIGSGNVRAPVSISEVIRILSRNGNTVLVSAYSLDGRMLFSALSLPDFLHRKKCGQGMRFIKLAFENGNMIMRTMSIE